MCDPSEVLCSNGLRIDHLALSLQKASQVLILNVDNQDDLMEKYFDSSLPFGSVTLKVCSFNDLVGG